MKLYHGTSQKALDSIMLDGLSPRGKRGGNFGHTVRSCPEAVYLTDAYPLYFSVVAADQTRSQGMVLEIETDLLDECDLNADEDVLEQIGRNKDDLPASWGMKARVRHYRNRLRKDRWDWRQSIKAMGTCSYFGTVPKEAITRIALIDFHQHKILARWAMDAQISLANYRFCSHDYKMMTAWVFGDEAPSHEAEDVAAWLARVRQEEMGPPAYMNEGRAGIEVLSWPFIR